jgi:hypothetical protein
MEALSVVVNSKLVADDVRHSTSGYDEVRRTADQALRIQRRRHRLWSALWRSVTAVGGRRAGGAESRAEEGSVSAEEVVKRPRLVAQSSGD